MKKSLRIFSLILLIAFISFGAAHAYGTAAGRIVKSDMSKRMIVLKMKSGTEKKVILINGCRGYKLNKPSPVTYFRVGEYVTVKLCSSYTDNPWRAELIMDSFSAKQYTAHKTLAQPVYTTKSGGFATAGGAAATEMPALNGVYPNAVSGVGGNNSALPNSVTTWAHQQEGSKSSNSNSPWASPGAVSGGSSASSGGGVSYDTGPSTSTVSKGTGSVGAAPSQFQDTGLTPNQAAWVNNPTKKAPTKKIITIQGRIREFEGGMGPLYVQDLGVNKIYTVTLKKSTILSDYMTKQKLISDDLIKNRIVVLKGILSGQDLVQAIEIRIQR